jgi:hypothetical protein
VTDRGPDLVEIAHLHRVHLDAPRPVDAGDEAVGPAVDVVAEHHVVAGTQHRPEEGVLGREAGGEGQPEPGALEGGEQGLQGVARRVAGAGVLVPAAQAADPVLDERGGLVDRRDDGTRRRVERLAGVDGAGVEAGGHGFPRVRRTGTTAGRSA